MASDDREPDSLAHARQRMQARFADASFSPCGLDARWAGTRWLGGVGDSDSNVARLELAPGEDPWEETSTQVRVEVRLPRELFEDDEANVEIEQAQLTREQVSRFWMATGTLDAEIRAAAFSNEAKRGEFTAPWADAEIPIDGTPLAFRRLGDDEYWLAQALHDRLLVSIESRAWPADSTGLVTIENLGPYIEGSKLIAARGRSRLR